MDRRAFAQQLQDIVGQANVIWEDYDLMLYEYDGSIDKSRPNSVVFPTTSSQVAEIVRLCLREKKPFTARGAGTGLSGGSLPMDGGVLIVFSKMDHICEVDLENLRPVVGPGG